MYYIYIYIGIIESDFSSSTLLKSRLCLLENLCNRSMWDSLGSESNAPEIPSWWCRSGSTSGSSSRRQCLQGWGCVLRALPKTLAIFYVSHCPISHSVPLRFLDVFRLQLSLNSPGHRHWPTTGPAVRVTSKSAEWSQVQETYLDAGIGICRSQSYLWLQRCVTIIRSGCKNRSRLAEAHTRMIKHE